MYLLVISVSHFSILLTEKENYKNLGFFCDADSRSGQNPLFFKKKILAKLFFLKKNISFLYLSIDFYVKSMRL